MRQTREAVEAYRLSRPGVVSPAVTPTASPIRHVSDTARWVAMYRAMESERPDAIFHDRYARRLAGAQGEQILQGMPQGTRWAWPMIVRTAVMDEIIGRGVSRDGVDVVLNLAAGLDARAYRLPLPRALRWIEVDYAGMLDYKRAALAEERPVCELEYAALDLADAGPRRELFARVGAAARRALVVSEGLLVYLTPAQVAALAADLHAQASFRWWLIDLASPMLLQWMQGKWGKSVAAGGAPFRFAPAEGVKFFEPHGWREVEFRSTMEEARRLKREMRFAWFWRLLGRLQSKARQEQFRRFAGVVLLERIP